MKKVAFIGLLVLLFNSCEEDKVIAPNEFSEVYRIYAEDMHIREDITGKQYYYLLDEPALTNYIFDKGIMQAFLYYKMDGQDTMSPLPFSDFVVENGYKREEQLTVEFQPGYITFILKIDDHSVIKPASEYYDFRVRFLW